MTEVLKYAALLSEGIDLDSGIPDEKRDLAFPPRARTATITAIPKTTATMAMYSQFIWSQPVCAVGV